MFKVMLVDDKQTIVDGLELLIDWKSLGFEVVAKATTAESAVEYAQRERIDLIITDIRMPGVSGLEMINELRQMTPATKYILVSAYTEFEYAKQALDYQVSGYLLKPIDKERLVELLSKIKTEIESKKKYLDYMYTESIRRIVAGDISEAKNLQPLNFGSKIRYIKIEKFCDADKVKNKQRNTAWLEQLKMIVAGYNTGFRNCFIIDVRDESIDCVIDEEHLGIVFVQYINGLEGILKKQGINDFIILIGKSVNRWEELGASMESAKNLSNILFYNEDKKIFFYDEHKNWRFASDMAYILSVDELREVCSFGENKIQEYVNTVHNDIVKRKVKPDVVVSYVNRLVFDISRYSVENGEEIKAGLIYHWSMITKCNNITHRHIAMFMMELLNDFYRLLNKLHGKSSSDILEEIIKYTQQNYSNNKLNLQWLAKLYYISPAYLGRVFKNKVGENYSQYLTKLRIEKAKEFLKNSDATISDIAHTVGFDDANYFYVKFQKLEGMTPMSFREKG